MSTEELRVWHNDNDWVIASTAEEAHALWAKAMGENAEDYEAEWEPWAHDRPFTFHEEDGSKTTKTCAEWIAVCGRGYFAGSDF